MKRFFQAFFSLVSLILLLYLTSPASAALTYGNGTYTNLCGSTTQATSTCNRGCNPSTGTCTSSSGAYVVKWTCNGKSIECREGESGWATSQSVSGTTCGKTVQLDVFDHNCRNGGAATWSCPGDSNLLDYMVWYSGDCTTPSPTPQNKSSCDSLKVTNGNNSLVPATVTLRALGSDNGGTIQSYRFFFGDGQQMETTNPEVTHKFESSGTFQSRVDIKDSKGVWKTSTACETAVTVRSLPIESHKSDCSDLFIEAGNYTQPPTVAKFFVSGFDNKGAIKRYKIDFGNGTSIEGDGNRFTQTYSTAGTYTIKGYILDSENVWKGGTGNCQKTLYVSTKPLTSQPKTGTPTIYTLLGIGSGIFGFGLLGYWKILSAPAQKSLRKHLKRTRRRAA